MTYKPEVDLFSPESLKKLKSLRDDIRQMERVTSVVTILDVPLLRNPPVPIDELVSNVKSLEDPEADTALAQMELGQSPIYQENLISQDMKTTALQINFIEDRQSEFFRARRSELKQKLIHGTITPEERVDYDRVVRTYKKYKAWLDFETHKDIATIRSIMKPYKKHAELFLGGPEMIVDDMITFVKNDLQVFGAGMLIFLVATLSVIFRKLRWVVLPILCCAFSVLCMTGLLGLFGWEVTVISSNFISLQLIITMSLTIHLIVRYRELLVQNPQSSQMALVKETVNSKFIPCLYTTLTTIAGFSSLLVCDILPVINFGLMMSVGLVVSLVVIFLLFPAALMLLTKDEAREDRQFGRAFTRFLEKVTDRRPKAILITTCVMICLIMLGVSRLTVENSFIDYFRTSTEIYQGMKVIDQEMGGTTPLDILIDFKAAPGVTDQVGPDAAAEAAEPDEGLDEFDEFDEFEAEADAEKYWFTSDKMALIKNIHRYLDSLPEIGKVLSLGTMMMVAEEFNDGEPLDNFQLALLYTELPEGFRDMVLRPFVSVADNQARLTIRIKDSMEGIQRGMLLRKIQHDVENHFELGPKRVHLTGLMVLYNNMLQSLFSSQILSMGYVVLALLIMFIALFHSVRIAVIAIFPNLLSSMAVLGLMGLVGLPLDVMTITIAAISIGIAVDNTIHYIHRFRDEFALDRDYVSAMHRCHGSIGNAMYYTSLTIIVGFSILIFSNFIPTVLFGLLTGFAMLIALLAALTLLPRLIIIFKPFGH
jgi:predicted RND superfamily exporter protein